MCQMPANVIRETVKRKKMFTAEMNTLVALQFFADIGLEISYTK